MMSSTTEFAKMNGELRRSEMPLLEESEFLTVQEMLARVKQIRERALVLESVPNSGYHDEDRNPARPEKYLAPQRNGWPRLSENLVNFYAEYDIIFVGPDAEKALAALYEWCDLNKNRDPWELSQNGTEAKMVRMIPKLKLSKNDCVPVLSLRRELWNDFLYVLHKMKVGLTGTPFEAQHGS